MRNVPDELAARIESGAATLCHVWLLRGRPQQALALGHVLHDAEHGDHPAGG
ncbi:hypothetical protein JIX59_16830, partial [Brevundimonas diminuta]|nr:hypothetical protein [Brevundimonas diminuta]